MFPVCLNQQMPPIAMTMTTELDSSNTVEDEEQPCTTSKSARMSTLDRPSSSSSRPSKLCYFLLIFISIFSCLCLLCILAVFFLFVLVTLMPNKSPDPASSELYALATGTNLTYKHAYIEGNRTIELWSVSGDVNSLVRQREMLWKLLNQSDQSGVQWWGKKFAQFERDLDALREREIKLEEANARLLRLIEEKDRLYSNNFCYIYSLSTLKKTWPEARENCKQFGGDLAMPRNQYQFDKIRSLCQYHTDKINHYGCWIGGQTISNVAKNFHLLNGDQINVTHEWWSPGEPNNNAKPLNVISEGCLEIFAWNYYAKYPKINTNNYLNDYNCLQQQYFICEINKCKNK